MSVFDSTPIPHSDKSVKPIQLSSFLDRHDACLGTAGSLPVSREVAQSLPALIQL
jgi:hypothetical protein